MENVDKLRALFPVTKSLAYLNHAGVAPLSRPAADAMRRAVDECQDWGASRYERLYAGVRAARLSAARLLSARQEEIAFVKNTSEGISLVAQGFPWREGDEVVVPEGEFPANVYPWLHLHKRGVKVLRVPMREGRLLADDYNALLRRPNVRLLAVSSVTFETGFVNDLAALGQLCAERGVFFFVDAIQSLGWQPIRPEKLGIHALAADGHKWMMGPEGAGLLWLGPEAQERIEPVIVGWNSVAAPLEFSSIRYELRQGAEKFEPGSQEIILLHGLAAALELLDAYGVERIERRVTELSARVRDGLAVRGYEQLSSPVPSEQGPIVSFRSRGDPEKLQKEFAAHKVFLAARGRGLRVSPHFYNDETDLDRFFTALDLLDR